MAVVKTRYGRLTAEMKSEIDKALQDPLSSHSTEMDIVPWLILLFVASLAGLTGSAATISWEMVRYYYSMDGDIINTALNNPELPGMIAGALGTVFCIYYYIRIHKRCGQVIFPGYVAKVRGSGIILLDIFDVVSASSSQFTYGTNNPIDGSLFRTGRAGTMLEAKLKDGGKFRILSGSSEWISRVMDHMGCRTGSQRNFRD